MVFQRSPRFVAARSGGGAFEFAVGDLEAVVDSGENRLQLSLVDGQRGETPRSR
jgi:hypothetical protein